MKTLKRKETLTIELDDIKTEEGKILHNLSKEELKEILVDGISRKARELKFQGTISDKKREFLSFKVNEKLLERYYETEKAYPHFVYHHFKNWHINSVDSSHSQNGGDWEYESYNPCSGWHHDVIALAKTTRTTNDHNKVSIRDSVLIHFYSGGVIRMYGTPMRFKTIRDFKSVEERKQFFDYILDSGMVSINKKERLTTFNPRNRDYKMLTEEYNTLGEAFLHHCIRNEDLETLKYLIEKKDLDLYAIDKKPYEKWLDKSDQTAHQKFYHGHGSTFLFRLIEELCHSNFEYVFKRGIAPYLYPNGRPVDKDDRDEKRYREKAKPTLDFFENLFAYINKKFPKLEIKMVDYDGKTINFDKSTAVIDVIKRRHGNDYEDHQLAYIQKLFFGRFLE